MAIIHLTVRNNWLRLSIRFAMSIIFSAMRLHWWIMRPVTRGVSAFCLTREGRIVLVYSTYERGWNLPSGGMARKEDASQSIVRELREELGLSAMEDMRFLGTMRHAPNFKDDTEFIFLITGFVFNLSWNLEVECAGEFALDELPDDMSCELIERMKLHGQTVAAAMRDNCI